MPAFDDEGRLLINVTSVGGPIPVPAWAWKNRLTSSVIVETDYTDVTGPVLTLETGVFVTLQSNAWLIIVG